MAEPGALRGGLPPGIGHARLDAVTPAVPSRPTVERQIGEIIEQPVDDGRRREKPLARDQECAAAAIGELRNEGTDAVSAGPDDDHALPRHEADDASRQIACGDPRPGRSVGIEGRSHTETVLPE